MTSILQIEGAPAMLTLQPETSYFDDTDRAGYFKIYVEFIAYLIKRDAESYRNASMMTTVREEKELLVSMVFKKMEMLEAFSVYFLEGNIERLETALGNTASPTDFLVENNFESFRGLNDVFHFAYRKEYCSLNSFEMVNRPNLDFALKSLLDRAAAYQRQTILYLDSRLYGTTRCIEPVNHEVVGNDIENRGSLIEMSGFRVK
jgi:hypothetical protein